MRANLAVRDTFSLKPRHKWSVTLLQFETELNKAGTPVDELLAIRLALYFRELHWELDALRQSKLQLGEANAKRYPRTSAVLCTRC